MAVCLVLGASGQIGRMLVPLLLAAGHEVHAPSRVPRQSTHERLSWCVGDLYAGMPALPRFEAIFSLGPLDGLATWLGASTFEGAPRLLAFGSMSALSKRGSSDPDERALAQRLVSSEQAVIAAADRRGMAWTFLRPTLIYGAGLDRSLTPLARFGTRWRVFPSMRSARGLRQPVHAADLADACITASTCAASIGMTYALGGGERLPFATMLERVRGSLGVRSIAVPVPLLVAQLGVPFMRLVRGNAAPGRAALRRLNADLIADDAAAREHFGWRPRPFVPVASTWHVQPLP